MENRQSSIVNRQSKIKSLLFRHLKKAHAFWSYDPAAVSLSQMSDDFLIEKVLYHLDCDDIKLLFEIYPKKHIKKVWKETLCPLGEYFGMMNIFYATVYFDIKNPEQYIRVQKNIFLKNKIHAGERFISQNKADI